MIRQHSKIDKGLSGFVQLAYIEGTGTQWIDTGFRATGGCIMDAELAVTTRSSEVIMGSHNPSNNSSNYYNRCEFAVNNATTVTFNKGGSYNTFAFTNQLNTLYRVIFNTIGTKRIGSINGTSIVNSNNAGGTLAPVNNIAFLYAWYYGRVSSSKAKLYSWKIYDRNSSLVRDFIPVIRVSDSKTGLYDLCGSICSLTGTPFYINAGTGEFQYGYLS